MQELNVIRVREVDSCTYVTTNDFDGEVFRIVSGKETFLTRGKSSQALKYKAFGLGGEYDGAGVMLACDRFTAYMAKYTRALALNDRNFQFPKEGDEVRLPSEAEARTILAGIVDKYEFVEL